MRIKIVNKSKHQLPSYATDASAGMDLRANIENNITIGPKQRALIPKGFVRWLLHNMKKQNG